MVRAVSRHLGMLTPRRRNAVLVAAALVAGAGLTAVAPPHHPVPALSAPSSVSALGPRAPGAPPAQPGAPAPPPPPAAEQVGLPATTYSEHALRPHEIFGFAPYWNLGAAGGYPLRELT